MIARFAAISLGLLMAGGAAIATSPLWPHGALFLTAEEQGPSEVERRLANEALARNTKVVAELARLGEHPWAGVYRTAGPWPTELALAPEAGFTLYHGSWCGNCARFGALGSVVRVEGATMKLQVEFAEPDDTSAAWLGLDDTLHLVRWGELVFAVPASRMELFCAEASDGATFPGVPFRDLGAPGDQVNPLRPSGKPAIPREFEHLLLDAPIEGKITALVEWRRRPELDGKELQAYDALFAVDAGTQDGLAVGMHLFVPGERRPGSPQRTRRGRRARHGTLPGTRLRGPTRVGSRPGGATGLDPCSRAEAALSRLLGKTSNEPVRKFLELRTESDAPRSVGSAAFRRDERQRIDRVAVAPAGGELEEVR